MTRYLMGHEPTIRLAFFLAGLVGIATWEAIAPRRARALSRVSRWPNNLGIVVLNTVLLRLAFPSAAVGLAILGEQRGWGFLNNLALPASAKILICVVLLDLVIYLQHVMFHAVPALWRVHRVHHADIDFDVTTGLRFHPIEIVLSMVIKLGTVAALGAPAVGVLIFEVLLNATAMFNHGNIALSQALDRVLRWIVVTPDMHRVHHSVLAQETNSNFGFNLPWWDRFFGTYVAQPRAGHIAMSIGLDVFRDRRQVWLDRMLLQPFLGPVGPYPLGSRSPTKVTSPTEAIGPDASARH